MEVRTVMITGATGGLGREMCRQFATEGWDVLAGWRGGGGLPDGFTDVDGRVRGLEIDMGDAQSIARAVDVDPPSPLAAVVINAARPPQVAPFGQIGCDEVRKQIEVSVIGPLALIQAVWHRHFAARRNGHVIVISTAAVGTPPAPGMAGYRRGQGRP